MDLYFQKKSNGVYLTRVLRDDSVVLEVPGFDRKHPLPHDHVHYIVESKLNLHQGFWSCVAAGAIFPGMHVVEGRQPPHAAEKSRAIIKAAGGKLMETEMLVDECHRLSVQTTDPHWPSAVERLKRLWISRRPDQTAINETLLKDVCALIHELQHRWLALPVDSSIQLTWPTRSIRKR